MSVLQTTAGRVHWAETDAGWPVLSELFDTIFLGRGNITPDVLDTSPLADQITVRAQTALPTRGQAPDPRNTGADPDAYTWLFRIPGQSEPYVASNVALGSSTSTALAIHADEVVWTEPYRDLLVWFNLESDEATLVTAFETSPVQAARLRASGPSANVLHGGRGSQVRRPDYVISRVNRGESVVLRARLYGLDDLPLRPADVRHVMLDIEREDAENGRWVTSARRSLSRCLIDIETQGLSAKFPYRGGHNFEYIVSGKETADGASRRFTYSILMCDGGTQKITQEVRVFR